MDDSEESASRQRWNFSVLTTYFVVCRVGWIFKLESVIMPAVLDALGGSATIRGALPVLSRLGNSLPQYVFSGHVAGASRLKGTLAGLTVMMALPWLLLAGLSAWSPAWTSWRWITVFLILYTWFWASNGMSILVQGVLQGKLVPARRRGRLLAISQVIAAVLGIVALLLVLLPTLRTSQEPGEGPAGFLVAFLATGVLFLIGSGSALFLAEPRSEGGEASGGLRELFRSSRELIRKNPHFRRFLIVVTLLYMLLILLPHFASLGRSRVGATGHDLVYWVIAQNVGTGLGSLVLGSLADRRGNRLALRVLLAWLALIPLVAIGLASLGEESGRYTYWIVFAMLGCAPVSQRILINYVLELAPSEEHARYLGTLNLWQMIPPLAAPLFGWLMEETSYEAVFLIGSAILFTGAWQAGRLIEPRE